MVSSKSLKQIVAAAAVMRYRRLKKMARRQRRRQMAMQQQQRSSSQGQGLASIANDTTAATGDGLGNGAGNSTFTSLLFQGGENNASMLTSGVSGQGGDVGVGALDDCPLDLLALRAERRVMRVNQGQRQGQAPGLGLGVSMTPPLGSFDEQGNNILSGPFSVVLCFLSAILHDPCLMTSIMIRPPFILPPLFFSY